MTQSTRCSCAGTLGVLCLHAGHVVPPPPPHVVRSVQLIVYVDIQILMLLLLLLPLLPACRWCVRCS
jgi:hypothetical protein